MFTTTSALRKCLKALFEAARGSSIKALGGGVGGGSSCGMLKASPSHCKAHVKLCSRRVLKCGTKLPVKIRIQMTTNIPHLAVQNGLIYGSNKLLLTGEEEQTRAEVTEGGKTNVWGI